MMFKSTADPTTSRVYLDFTVARKLLNGKVDDAQKMNMLVIYSRYFDVCMAHA